MKELNINETRLVTGGRWRCTKCKRTYILWINCLQHKNNYACYTGKIKWVW